MGFNVSQEEILTQYSDRITTSLEAEKLATLLQRELLPNLLIRQSALLRIGPDGMQSFFSLGIDDEQIPTMAEIPDFETQVGKFQSPSMDESANDILDSVGYLAQSERRTGWFLAVWKT